MRNLDVLPRSVKLIAGATSPGVSDQRLRQAVTGKIIMVTGASSGVGEATARRLGRAGATVLVVARRAERLEELCDKIRASGGTAYAYPTDLTDTEACAKLAVEVLEKHGHVDVLVNNAGKSIRRWLSESVDRFDNFEQTTMVNYLGPVRLILGLLPSMRERRSGHIVYVSTAGVHAPPVEWTAYIASKSAMENWLRGAGPELQADGIASTTIHMQMVRSEMLGPFRVYRYVPGMVPEEAAGMVCRAVVDRPKAIRPWWERAGVPLLYAVENTKLSTRVMTAYAKLANPSSRPGGRIGKAIESAEHAAEVLDDLVGVLLVASEIGIHRTIPLRSLPKAVAALRGGLSPATVLALLAARYPHRSAIIDDFGSITAGELHQRVERLAAALREHHGVSRQNRVGVLCTNHRGFAEGLLAAARLSCDLVPLNYSASGPQLREVLKREKVDVLVYDAEFHPQVEESGFHGVRVIARYDGEPPKAAGASTPLPSIDSLVKRGGKPVKGPAYGSALVIMTAGSTGTPKGAPRSLGLREAIPIARQISPKMLKVVTELPRVGRLKAVPRAGKPMILAVPLHHGYGLGGLLAGFLLASPIIMHRKFDAEQTLADIEQYGVTMACLVPTMLKRILDLPEETRRGYDTSSLKAIPNGAAPLPPQLGTDFMDEFGDILYNAYGSTEVGPGAIAFPEDLRAAPGTVGYPPRGIVDIKILDEDGNEVPVGTSGRIYNRNPVIFQGYSDGRHKEFIDGYARSGDVGHFDEAGRLFIDGRDDDMILSGGENVFPQEVEELLLTHPAIADAGAVGVPDDDFGARLATYVVLKPGASLTADGVRDFVKANLARYKVPRDVEFVAALPRTTTGKLQRKRLGEPATAAPKAAAKPAAARKRAAKATRKPADERPRDAARPRETGR